VIAEFRRRYALIGGSPLVEITQKQANALEKMLNDKGQSYGTFRVACGMRFSEPFITDMAKNLAKKSDILIGIIMSPQYSPIIMKGYLDTLKDAVCSFKKLDLRIIEDWHKEPLFLQAVAEKVSKVLDGLPSPTRKKIKVLLTAHSMPKRVVEREHDYISALIETAEKVAALTKIPKRQWQFCYQSAGHTKEEWLKPDFADLMPEIKKEGYTDVLIAPVQFLADHLETLYDIAIGAREEAEEHGIVFHQTEALNTSPLFIETLSHIIINTL